MPKFAVYYIPQAEDPFYQAGTRILGYDVRARQTIVPPSDPQALPGPSSDSWTTICRPYGFHLTICEALDCNWTSISRIEQELADMLSCFDPRRPFLLQRKNDHPIGIWGKEGSHSIVLLYEPNTSLRMLHTLLVGRLTTFGTGSGFLKQYLLDPERKMSAHLRQQIRFFASPTVLENWYPHFTLLNPYAGKEVAATASRFDQTFQIYRQITVQTICLLIQSDNETNWQIVQEFQR
jgi:hypothetical protein